MKKSIRKFVCQFILAFFAAYGTMELFTEIYPLVTGSVFIPWYARALFTILAAVALCLLIWWGEIYKKTPARCFYKVERDETGAPRFFEWTDGHQKVRLRLRDGEQVQIGGTEE